MTIHHVLVTNSFMTATMLDLAAGAYTRPPAAGKMSYEVGVGVVSGQASDSANYTQVAHGMVFPDAAASTNMVDFMDMNNYSSSIKISGGAPYYVPQRWEQSIFAVPLVRGTHAGTGYAVQGKPFFVGEGATNGLETNAREPVGNPASAGNNINPPSAGMEQFIEVRMTILPRQPVFDSAGSWQSNFNDWANFSGCGGSWVYIIGKKHMRT